MKDSRTTENYVTKESLLINVKPTISGPTAITLDNTTSIVTHEGMLDFPTLRTKARIAHAFPTLGKSLFSIASICDSGGTAKFAEKDATVHFDDTIAPQRPRDHSTRLWTMPLSTSKPSSSTQIIPKDSNTPNHMPSLFPPRPKLSKTTLQVLETTGKK